MTWQDRLQDAVLETAAGDRFVFEFRDVGYSRTDKITEFTYPERQRDYIQKRSLGSLSFDWQITFSGSDCDEIAQAFEDATIDNRPMTLTYPLKSELIIVQLLSLNRLDALATAANEVSFSISMRETQELDTTIQPENLQLFIDNTVNSLILINSNIFPKVLEIKEPGILKKVKAGLQAAVAAVSSVTAIYDMATDAIAEFQSIITTAENLVQTIDATISTAGKVTAAVVQGAINYPAKTLNKVQDRLDYYADIIENLDLGGTGEGYDEVKRLVNSIAIAGYCQASVSPELESTVDIESAFVSSSDVYATKKSIYDRADYAFEAMHDYFDFLDSIESSVEANADIVSNLSSIVNATVGRLSVLAFGAKQERTRTILINSDIYILAYKLLRISNTDQLDDEVRNLLNVNKIGDDEMFEVKKDRTIKYYI